MLIILKSRQLYVQKKKRQKKQNNNNKQKTMTFRWVDKPVHLMHRKQTLYTNKTE